VKGIVQPGESHAPLSDAATERAIDRLDRIRYSKGKTASGEIRLAMQRTMQRHCAVFRTGSLLQEGAVKLGDIIATMRDDLMVADRSMMFNTDLTDAHPGKRQPALGDWPHRESRRSCAGGFSEARR
jgi:succinate dehydrogenase / fumarate reductase flavoprotein subunit